MIIAPLRASSTVAVDESNSDGDGFFLGFVMVSPTSSAQRDQRAVYLYDGQVYPQIIEQKVITAVLIYLYSFRLACVCHCHHRVTTMIVQVHTFLGKTSGAVMRRACSTSEEVHILKTMLAWNANNRSLAKKASTADESKLPGKISRDVKVQLAVSRFVKMCISLGNNMQLY